AMAPASSFPARTRASIVSLAPTVPISTTLRGMPALPEMTGGFTPGTAAMSPARQSPAICATLKSRSSTRMPAACPCATNGKPGPLSDTANGGESAALAENIAGSRSSAMATDWRIIRDALRLVLAEDDRRVVAAEAERVIQRDAHLLLPRGVRHVIEI